MLSTDQTALLRVPGRIILDPTDLTASFPFGGTYLGLVRELAIALTKHVGPVAEEAFGRRVLLDALELGESWGLAGVLRASDQGQLPVFTMQSNAGAVTGETGILYPGSTLTPTSGQKQVGTWLGNRARKVAFVPIDLRQWVLYFPRAIAYVEGAAKMAASIAQEFGIPFSFWAQPNGTDAEWVQWRPREDISL